MAKNKVTSYEDYNKQLTELLELLNLDDRKDLSKVLSGIYATNALRLTDPNSLKKAIRIVIKDSNRETFIK